MIGVWVTIGHIFAGKNQLKADPRFIFKKTPDIYEKITNIIAIVFLAFY